MIIVMMTIAISRVIMMMMTTSVREESISLVAMEPGYSLKTSSFISVTRFSGSDKGESLQCIDSQCTD